MPRTVFVTDRDLMKSTRLQRTDETPTVQMIGTLPPWKGIPAYCKEMFEGINQQLDHFKFTGWKHLYPASLYPGGDPKTNEEPVEGDNVERSLSWYNPISWISVGLDSDVELVHAQWWSYPLAIPYISIFTVGKLRGKTVLVTVHNVEPHEQNVLTRFLNDLVYWFADEYVVHSEENKSQFSQKAGIDPERIHVISHPTIGPDKQGISNTDACRELALSPDRSTVLFFGNIRDYKGLDSLVRMVDSLNDGRDVDLLIAGKCWEDWEKYEKLIQQHGLGDNVHRYPGFIPEDELELFFTAADVVALPYEYFDAQSGVAGLANHFRTVSVGYDEGGLAHQVDLVASTESEFEQLLTKAIDSDVEKTLPTDDSVDKHIKLYNRILGNARD